MSPLRFYSLPDGLCEGVSERGEAIEYGDAAVNFRDLPVEISCRQTLAQQLDTMHFRLDAASSIITVPSSPDGPPETLASPQGFIAGYGSR